MAEILRKYKSDFGQHYVQVEGVGGELSFDHDPTDKEVQAVLDAMIVAESIELVAENGETV